MDEDCAYRLQMSAERKGYILIKFPRGDEWTHDGTAEILRSCAMCCILKISIFFGAITLIQRYA